MKDTEYFNDTFYISGNSELKKVIKELSKEHKISMYLIIDEAFRQFVEKHGKTFDKKPRVAELL